MYTKTLRELQNNIKCDLPHVIILGAGASRAAFPNGDKNGKKLPLMNDFVETISDLKKLLEKYNFSRNDTDNFEIFYSNLKNEGSKEKIINEIEHLIRSYFSGLELPDYPTIYDHLFFCLREKDVIATFNWDPLLPYAARRLYNMGFHAITKKIKFLHGNVAISFDKKNRKIKFSDTQDEDGNFYQSVPLLYPVKNKDYNKNEFIKNQWGELKDSLEKSSILTIFGYGAPKTDVEAMGLIEQGWGASYQKNCAQIEIIDTKEEDPLRETWDNLIHNNHYSVHSDFYSSFIAKYPRRSCEAMLKQNFETDFLDDGTQDEKIHERWKKLNFQDLIKWFAPFTEKEKK